jgi:hypothetical protein
MRRTVLLALCALSLATLAYGQQQPQPLPQPMPQPRPVHDNPAMHKMPLLRFPVSAAEYHQYVLWQLDLAKIIAQRGVGGHAVSPADINKLTLHIRDCETRVAGDGWVSEGEHMMCQNETTALIHELAVPYIVKSGGGD